MSSPEPAPLTPLDYQRAVVEYLKRAEPELWRWASSAEVRGAAADQLRSDILKTHYRIDAEGHPEIAAQCSAVATRLGVTVPVSLYQAPGSGEMNAYLCHLPEEALIVLCGPILSTLQGLEFEALIAHELAHHRLWERDRGDFLIADRLLLAAANDSQAAPSHGQTARRYRLYTEIFADRGALLGCGQLEPAVAALIKTETGLAQASAASYLRQADEIFSRENPTTQGLSHPETFIRARALRLWSEQDPGLDAWLSATIEGQSSVDTLDLAGQHDLQVLTRRFLAEMLRPRWFRTAATLAHAKAFFPDFTPAETSDASLTADLLVAAPSFQEYFSYLLLDFAAIDRELDAAPLAAALDWSERLDLTSTFDRIAMKELGLQKRQLAKLKKEVRQTLDQAEVLP